MAAAVQRSDARAEQRREQCIGLLNFTDVGLAPGVEHRGGDDQDRRVDEQSQHQRDGAVGGGKPDRFAFALLGRFYLPRLHDRRVQIEIVRHHRRSENSDGDVEHLRIGHDLM